MTEEKTPLPQNFELCRRKRINLCSFRSKWIGWYKIYRKKWHTAWIRLHISLASAGISVCVCASVRHDTSVEFYIYRWRLAAELNVYTLCPFFTFSRPDEYNPHNWVFVDLWKCLFSHLGFRLSLCCLLQVTHA